MYNLLMDILCILLFIMIKALIYRYSLVVDLSQPQKKFQYGIEEILSAKKSILMVFNFNTYQKATF